MTTLRIGTRGSPLALWQAHYVADRLRPLANVELVEIETAGDAVRDRPLSQIGGDGVFTKEIQRALLDGQIDLAVHSLKDLPTTHVAGLCLAAVPQRAGAGDAFVSSRHACFDLLPHGAKVGTSSLRRRAQVLARRPDLTLVDVRGNVETRLRKLDEQGLDALILAQAGLERLGLQDHMREVLDTNWMLPAVGQGALGLECRIDDERAKSLAATLDDPVTRQCVTAERALLRALGGGCQVPVGAVTTVDNGMLSLRGAVVQVDGRRKVQAVAEGLLEDAEDVGIELAARLLAAGARELLASG